MKKASVSKTLTIAHFLNILINEMSMIEKTPTEDEYEPCEFHVTIENQLYTHEMSIKQAIPTADEYSKKS